MTVADVADRVISAPIRSVAASSARNRLRNTACALPLSRQVLIEGFQERGQAREHGGGACGALLADRREILRGEARRQRLARRDVRAMIIDRQSVPWNSWIRRPVEATKDTPRMR